MRAQVEIDVVCAAREHLIVDATGNDVAWGQVLPLWGVALHECFAPVIEQHGAGAANGL